MMAYYRTKHYGVEASVDAVNQDSADKQLQWLLKGSPCYCTECREGYYKDYSIRLLQGYDTTKVTCTQEMNQFRLV